MNIDAFHRLEANTETLHLMMGGVVFLVLLFAVTRLLLLRRAKMKRSGTRTPDTDWRYGTPVEERPDEKLTDISTAMYLWQQNGIMCTHKMLESLDIALNQAGYELTRDLVHGHFLPDAGCMRPHLRKQVAADFVRAKELFWAPEQTAESVDELVRLSQKSGYSERMLEDVLENLGKRGWHLRELRSSWELCVYPLKQVVVKLTGRYDAGRADFIRYLEHLACHLQEESSVAETNCLNEMGVYGGPEKSATVRYSVNSRLCTSPPGFFPESHYGRLPPSLTEEMLGFNASLENHIVILLQRTRTASPEMLPAFLKRVIGKLEEGQRFGMDEDDDTGYAFSCQGRCFD
jgi:hypothetical protein